MFYKTNLLALLFTTIIVGSLSRAIAGKDDIPKECAVPRARVQVVSAPEDTSNPQGLFGVVSNDLLRLLTNRLDIRSLARLERASQSMMVRIRQEVRYREDETKPYVTWADVRMIRLPNPNNLPWPLWHQAGRLAFVEASIAFHAASLEEKADNLELATSLNNSGKRLLDIACTLGDPDAIGVKIEALVQGKYNYPEDFETASAHNERLVEQGYEPAIERKVQWLEDSDPKLARAFNEGLVEQGNKNAMLRKMIGLGQGVAGYSVDPKAKKTFISSLFTQLATWPVGVKIEVLGDIDADGSSLDPETARSLNETLVQQGEEAAIKRKVEGLTWQEYGYGRNPEAARLLIVSAADQGKKWALVKRAWGLLIGTYGFNKDITTGLVHMDKLVEQGNEWAIDKKIVGLQYGGNGYPNDPASAYMLARIWLSPLVIE